MKMFMECFVKFCTRGARERARLTTDDEDEGREAYQTQDDNE
jgi:hypothetical protein